MPISTADGDLDIYLRQGRLFDDGTTLDETLGPFVLDAPPTDRYYRSDRLREKPGFTLVDATGELAISDHGMGAAAGDYDADGAVDLYLTSFGHNRLLRNRGDGTFEDVTQAAGVGDDRFGQVAVFFDYDRDGWLDLYVQNYVDFSMATHKPCYGRNSAIDYCGPLSFKPEPDRLFRNLADGTFEDVSGASGIARAYGAGLGAVARDFDGDAWLDLFVSNDGGENLLWINRGDGSFVENAQLAGCAVNSMGAREGSMGIAAADFDADLDVDLFITHLSEETNTLYANDGGGYFTDATASAGLAVPSRGYTGFGTAPIDLDNDGLPDLVAVNGEVRAIPEQDAAGDAAPLRQRNQVFRNLGGGAFGDVSVRVLRGQRTPGGEPRAGRRRSRRRRRGGSRHHQQLRTGAGPVESRRRRGALAGRRLAGPSRPAHESRESSGGDCRGAIHLRYASSDGSYLAASDPRVIVGLEAPAPSTPWRSIGPSVGGCGSRIHPWTAIWSSNRRRLRRDPAVGDTPSRSPGSTAHPALGRYRWPRGASAAFTRSIGYFGARAARDRPRRFGVSARRCVGRAERGGLGALGRLYDTYKFRVAAATCYRNARTLAPDEFQWHYYSGRLARMAGDLAAAETASPRRSLSTAMTSGAGRARATASRSAAARGRGEDRRRPRRDDPASAAGLQLRAEVAVERRDWSQARTDYEQLLALQPEADRLHRLLAIACRELGDADCVRRHLARRAPGPSGSTIRGSRP